MNSNACNLIDLDLVVTLDDPLRSNALLLRLGVDAVLDRLLRLCVGRGRAGGRHALLVRAVLVVRAEHEVPPAEGGAIVVHEGHVVEVVVVGAGPEGDDVLERPGEVCGGVVSTDVKEDQDRKTNRSQSGRRWPGRDGG
jgi:hypothetical protein